MTAAVGGPAASRRDPAAVPLALAGITAIYALVLMVVGSPGPLLYLLPALLIFVPLLLGRTPGDEKLARFIVRARRPRRRVRPPAPLPVRRGNSRRRVAGGRLIARAMAGRAPPLHGSD